MSAISFLFYSYSISLLLGGNRQDMKKYSLRRMGREGHPEIIEAINKFWKGKAEIEAGEPIELFYFPSKQSLWDWLYQLYLDAFYKGTLPFSIIVIPNPQLGGWRNYWEGIAFEGYQISAIKEQHLLALKLTAVHELGHLLGLPDHLSFNRCIMNWVPWFLIPLRFRNICPACAKIIKDVE